MAIGNSFNNTLRGEIGILLGDDALWDMYFRADTTEGGYLKRLPIGSNGQMLTVTSEGPAWVSGATPGGNAGGDLEGSYPNPTIKGRAISFAKMQAIATARILGRVSANAGDIEELTVAQLQTLLGLGAAAYHDAGLSSGDVPVLDANGQLDPQVMPNLAITSVQVVADLAARLALTNVQAGDVVKQLDDGQGRPHAYILAATPASVEGNWVSLGDTTITAADIISGLINTARLGNGTANNNTFLRGDQSWQPLPFIGLPFAEASGATAMSANNGYRTTAGTRVTLTLPASAPVDSIIQIVGVGAGGWRVAQNANQQIHFGNHSSTVGLSGRLDSMHHRDSLVMQCVVANNEWQVTSAVGNIDVVG